jgi:uncharacterized protein with gpF-like domain
MRKKRGEKVLRPVHPNAGIAAAYRKALDGLIEEMQRSYVHWLRAAYRANPPRIAQDETPAKEMERKLNELGSRWEKKWDDAADKLGRWFAKSAKNRSEASLHKILKDAGVSVEFKMTPTVRDVYQAVIAENVGLIKSIPQQYHTEVQGMVMRSVSAGRDLKSLTDDLEKRYGITRRRAAFIARDQNSKATAVITRARQQEAGITEAVWLHSAGGKTKRRTHVANSGKRYLVAEGWHDPDQKVNRKIFPGELVGCRCVSKPVIRGFT